MMFGHIETNLERMQHFADLRQVQSEKPADAKGFLAFIPWPFQDEDTILRKIKRARNAVTGASINTSGGTNRCRNGNETVGTSAGTGSAGNPRHSGP